MSLAWRGYLAWTWRGSPRGSNGPARGGVTGPLRVRLLASGRWNLAREVGDGAWVGRIGRGDREREPRRVTGDAGVADRVTELDRGDRAPHQVVVFRVVQRDGGVGQGEVQVLEHGGRPLQAGVPVRGELAG